LSPFRYSIAIRQDALQPCKTTECLRLLHNGRIRSRRPCSPLRCPLTPDSLRQAHAAQRAGVSPPTLLQASILTGFLHSVKGRPHYYSTTKEEYAHIRFDLEAGSVPYLPSSTQTPSYRNRKLIYGLNRLLLPLQLEHKTALHLHPRHLPLPDPLVPPLASRYLGLNNPLRIAA